MTESDERLDAVAEKIDEAKAAAKSLTEQDVIEPAQPQSAQPQSAEPQTQPAQPRADESDG
jgi:hypothetical protein